MTRIKEKLKVYSEEKQARILELKVKLQDHDDRNTFDERLLNELKEELIDNEELHDEIIHDICLRIKVRPYGVGFVFEEERIKKNHNIYYDVIRATENFQILLDFLLYRNVTG